MNITTHQDLPPAQRFGWARVATLFLASSLSSLTASTATADAILQSQRAVAASSFQTGLGSLQQSFSTTDPGPWSSSATAMISSASQTSNVAPNLITASISTGASGSGFGQSTSSSSLDVTISIDAPSLVTIAGGGQVSGSSFNQSAYGTASCTLNGPGGNLFGWGVTANGGPGSPTWSGSFGDAIEVLPGTYTLSFGGNDWAGSGGAGSSSSSGVNLTLTVEITPLGPPGLYVPAEYPTIAAAIAAAVDGDTIYIAPGVYLEHQLTLTKKVSILPTDEPGDVIIDGGGLAPGILFLNGNQGPETLIKGITFRNSGGGTPLPNAPQFDAGGAILIHGGSPRIEACVFTGNHASYGAAVYTIASAAQFIDCVFEENAAGEDGGALQALNSPVTVTNCLFLSNSAAGLGGALHCPYGDGVVGQVTVTNCQFRGNSAGLGGAMTFDTAPPLRTLVVISSIVECNQAAAGGAFWSTAPYANIIELTETTVCSNTDPQFIGQAYANGGGNTVCTCTGDLDGNGTVGAADLSLLLGGWGPTSRESTIDLNCDGAIDSADLAILLGSWGPC